LSTGEIIINIKFKNMYRFLFSLPLASAIILMASCSGNKKEQPANSTTTVKPGQTEVVFNEKLQAKIGSWVKQGTECYGIVIAELVDKKTIGKSVKCKIIALKPDMIKLKTLESINLMESRGCDKLGLSYGDTWWEEEGDLFKTREEADAYLKEKGWLTK
jgi:hypothetical protein